MYKRLLVVTFTLLTLCALLTFLPIHSEAEIYDSVIRLHVIANSDSEVDQELKLCVRDEILKSASSMLDGCNTREQAIARVSDNLCTIEERAAELLADKGYPYSVSVELSEEEYPTKNYESFCFPSGEYLSLRVNIGEAQGQNWWCVLYPPMCLSAASESEAIAQVGLTDAQYSMITETEGAKYKVRFKILEAIEKAVR